MRKIENGFTLFEVLVSMFITGVALLGLALMEVHILKSSQSSFNYTVATIRANTLVESVWMDLCNAQSASQNTYSGILTSWSNEIRTAGMTEELSSVAQATAPRDMLVKLNWTDPRFINVVDDPNNTLTLTAKFPDSGCG